MTTGRDRHGPAPFACPETRNIVPGDAGPVFSSAVPSSPLPDTAIPAVLDWYDAHARDLPWRDGRTTPWGVLVSEIMLQQTPVARVEPRWREWMHRWPTPRDLAQAPTAEVLRMWDRLGYPRRALRLQECARAVTERFAGELPRDEQVLRSLPGIGEYTAAAVTAFAHQERAVVADTNVRRVLARVVSGVAQCGPALTAAERVRIAACVPEDVATSVRWNQAVMELGALVCTARSPDCERCPLAAHCAFLAAGRPEQTGPRRPAQRFAGTDRQMRGAIMAQLRERSSVPRSALDALDPTDPERVSRCLASLVADGLARLDDSESGCGSEDCCHGGDEKTVALP